MPYLEDVTYSREATITAVRDYYKFLGQMYLDDHCIREPPAEGWSDITTESLQELAKSHEVISLLRNLPYIDRTSEAQGAPRGRFADWPNDASSLASGTTDAETLKVLSEGPDFPDTIPSHVISLTSGGRDNPVFLLDTELGVVYWLECPNEMRPPYCSHEPILDAVEDYSPDEEAEWRDSDSGTGVWAIADFFEVLKYQFRQLNFYPLPGNKVELIWGWQPNEEREASREIVQRLYREHGWPDIERFRKSDCVEAVKRELEERFPDAP